MTLLGDLQAQVRRLSDDLRERSEQEPFASHLKQEHSGLASPPAPEIPRTALSYAAWREDRIVQAAVAWVLSTVFVRFCEDNDFVELPWIAGPGDRLDLAVERAEQRARTHPDQTDRDWLEVAFEGLSSSPVAAGLFDRAHNPLWSITPSHEGAKELLAFWRRRNPDGTLVHDLTDWDTRELGQLYQELSEHAKDTYALLQTPEFVEKFILDLTLKPAIEEFGLHGLRVIDPTCGSGHFLIGVFRRLLDRWREEAPAVNDWELIRRALDSVHGVDKNPFAAAIARFRLMIEAMRAGGIKRLDAPVTFPLHIAVGDSLLHGRGGPGAQIQLYGQPNHNTTEDVEDYIRSVDILGRGTYHVVVGNPPYITVKDKAENQNYRDAYPTCAGTYALSVPFAERFFNLARRAGGDRKGAGYVGQITANSFMKREFGKKLVVNLFGQKVELTRVIDTSGAFIPGHGTPTVILIGRNQIPRESLPVLAVLGVRSEPSHPENPAEGLVWRAIVDQYDRPDSESEWVTVAELNRDRLRKHPWSLSGGGASAVVEHLEGASKERLSARITRVGFFGDTHADEAFSVPSTISSKMDPQEIRAVPAHRGDQIRDWRFVGSDLLMFPYDSNNQILPESALGISFQRYFWPVRTLLWARSTFGGGTYRSEGRPWWSWHQLPRDAAADARAVVFAEVATHNHFVLDHRNLVFNRTAPIIKLPKGASEDDHLALLAVLNSSVACFWLKQMCQEKGGSGLGRGVQDEAWEGRYQFNGAKIEQFPVPVSLPLEFGRSLDKLGQSLTQLEPAAACAQGVPARERLDEAHRTYRGLWEQIIAWQEELDWDCYRRYKLLTSSEAAGLLADVEDLPDVRPGERAFEIVLARAIKNGQVDSQWFVRHGSTPVTEIPERWPAAYREVVQRRIEAIERRRDLALIERPECKRRWQFEPWEVKERAALRDWLLDRCEDRRLWFRVRDGESVPRLLTVNQLADALRLDQDFVAVAQLLAIHLDMRDADLAAVLKVLVGDEHVPFLAALRYKDSGLRKRAEWESVWEQQREEDRTGQQLEIAVPQKY